MNRATILLLLTLVLCSGFSRARFAHADPATSAPALFDPARHMRVSEVKPGMKGYGLSVFKGTAIERFDVEVISVLRDFNQLTYDVILISCKGANLEHTGSVAGMSGSPIYLRGTDGTERMVGAFAYGWPLMKDPVGGVQPIEYMLEIPTEQAATRPASGPATAPVTADAPGDATAAIKATDPVVTDRVVGKLRWKLSDSVMLPGITAPPRNWPFAAIDSMKPNPRLMSDDNGDVARLRPLATPLMVSGLPPKVLETFGPIFKAYGLLPLQAGGVGVSGKGSAKPQAAA